MPRKQRFKPSRKPKPAEAPVSNDQARNPRSEDPNTEPARPSIDPGDIEGGGPMRSREDTSSSVEGTRPQTP
jgi:hypothetical protein